MGAELQNKSDNKIQKNYIQLKEDTNILKLWIRDEKGNETGEFLKFNLKDIELPMKYQTLMEEDKKARLNLKNQLTIIDKKQDHKGKKLFSANEEAKIKAFADFFKKEEEIYNMFLGENGVKKILNGEALSWTSLRIIDEIIEEQIQPQLNVNAEDIKSEIMAKYSDKRDDVIE